MTDSFRDQRIENYRVKSAAGFRCEHVDPEASTRCEEDWGLLVCHSRGALTARCKKHRVGKPAIGQWDSRPPYSPMADPTKGTS